MDSNESEGVVIRQPITFPERESAAQSCSADMSLTMPIVVDDMENSVDNAYAGWPERLFVVGRDGKIAYAGDRGPFGFNPEHVKDWLKKNL